MKPNFEILPKVGVGPVKLGSDRATAIKSMGAEPDSFMKTPMSEHPTDAFLEAGLQIFYEGEKPKVSSIELSRGCEFDVTIFGIKIPDLPVPQALLKIKEHTGIEPTTDDNGYTYEIPQSGLWLWRPCIDSEEGNYFSTIGISLV